MKQSMEEFRNLASRYRDLYQASFDADSATLRNVELYPPSFGRLVLGTCSPKYRVNLLSQKYRFANPYVCYS